MIIKASNESKIFLKESYVVGDRKTDIDAGLKVGCKTILLTIIMMKKNQLNRKRQLNLFMQQLSIF